MPIFEFNCTDCGQSFEVLIRNGDSSNCPKCHSRNTQKRMSTFSFKFVGYPGFVDRIDDLQKRQVDRGEKPTLPHPSQVL